MIITWDMLGLIGDYCGKIQFNSDKVRQNIDFAKGDLRTFLFGGLRPFTRGSARAH